MDIFFILVSLTLEKYLEGMWFNYHYEKDSGQNGTMTDEAIQLTASFVKVGRMWP